MNWLQPVAAFFLGIAAVGSFVRYARTKNNGQLFISFAFLIAAAIFGYLTFTSIPR